MNLIFRTNMISKFTFRNEAVRLYEPTSAEDYEYTISNNSVTVTKYIGSAVNIAVPLKIEGMPVKKIGSGAFMRTKVETVKIPEGVIEIE